MARRRRSPEYILWAAMKGRCQRVTAPDYERYGGRGITLCERWQKFENFYADMGPRPSPKHSLDRIDNNGNYEPGNVRWASLIEQANNKRNTRYVEYRGKRMSVSEAVAAAGEIVSRENAICRLNNGWPVEEAVERPPLFRRDPVTRKIVKGKQTSRWEKSSWWS